MYNILPPTRVTSNPLTFVVYTRIEMKVDVLRVNKHLLCIETETYGINKLVIALGEISCEIKKT